MNLQLILQEAINSKFQLFSGLDYLKIDISNNIGFDKLNYTDRLAKFKKLVEPNINKDTKPEKIKALLDNIQAEEPVLAFAGILAYIDYLNNRPSGYRISLDAVASGTQIMSALTADINGLYLTGALGNTRNDVYTEITKQYNLITGQNIQVSRKTMKDVFMPFLYGSSAKPKELLGKENVKYFHQTASQVTKGAYELRNTLVSNWDSTKDVQKWLLPDNYTAYIPVMVQKKYTMKHNNIEYTFKVNEQSCKPTDLSNAANTIHSLDGYIMREMIRRSKPNYKKINHFTYLYTKLNIIDNLEPIEPNSSNLDLLQWCKLYEKSEVLSIGILDHIKSINDLVLLSDKHQDALYNICTKLSKQPSYDLCVVHDCFTFLPDYGNYVRYWYNDILANIVNSNCLSFLVNQVSPIPIEYTSNPIAKQQLAELVKQSNYAIC